MPRRYEVSVPVFAHYRFSEEAMGGKWEYEIAAWHRLCEHDAMRILTNWNVREGTAEATLSFARIFGSTVVFVESGGNPK